MRTRLFNTIVAFSTALASSSVGCGGATAPTFLSDGEGSPLAQPPSLVPSAGNSDAAPPLDFIDGSSGDGSSGHPPGDGVSPDAGDPGVDFDAAVDSDAGADFDAAADADAIDAGMSDDGGGASDASSSGDANGAEMSDGATLDGTIQVDAGWPPTK